MCGTSIKQGSCRVYLNIYMEKRLYLAPSGIMQLNPSWVKMLVTCDPIRYSQAVVNLLFPENRIVYSPYLQPFRGLVCCNWDKVNTAVPVSTQLGGPVSLFPFILFCWLSFFFFFCTNPFCQQPVTEHLKIVRWPWIMSAIASVWFFLFHVSFFILWDQ